MINSKKFVLVVYDKHKPVLQDTETHEFVFQKINTERDIYSVMGIHFQGVIFEGNLSEFVIQFSLSRLRW